jgi:hypothetical protein
MFRFSIDLDLGMVGTEMTLATGLRFPCFSHGKSVTRVTAGTTPQAAIRIDPANSDIGPRTLHGMPGNICNRTAVTGIASRRSFDTIIHAVKEPFIDGVDDFQCMGVLASGILFYFIRVTLGASSRRHKS